MLRSMRLGMANDALLDGMRGTEIRVKARSEELLREVLAKEKYAGEVTRLASHDTLTGLYNRASLSARLEAALTDAQRRNGCVAVLFIDLNKFKEVNDVRGHFAGDQVLKKVTGRLRSRLGPHADLVRWGGDEFVVVLRNLISQDGAEALEFANGLCECLAEPIDPALESNCDFGLIPLWNHYQRSGSSRIGQFSKLCPENRVRYNGSSWFAGGIYFGYASR